MSIHQPDEEKTKTLLEGNMSNNTNDRTLDPNFSIVSPLVLSFSGIMGNVIALIVLYRSRKQQTKTVFYVLIGGLIWTDLIGIILTTPPVISVYLNNSKLINNSMCKYHAFVMVATCIATHLMVCTMAIERFIGIRHAYFYSKHFNHTRARIVILINYVFVITFTSFPLLKFGSYEPQYPDTWCFLNIHPTEISDIAYSMLFASINLTCTILVIGCNVFVIIALLQMWKNRTVLTSSNDNDKTKIKCFFPKETEIQMVLLLIGITCIFTMCWAPMSILIILNTRFKWDYKRADLLAVRLATINQILDPWVYILFRKVFIMAVINCAKKMFFKQISSSSPKKMNIKHSNKVISIPLKKNLEKNQEELLQGNSVLDEKETNAIIQKSLEDFKKVPRDKVLSPVALQEDNENDVFLNPRNNDEYFDLPYKSIVKPSEMFRSFSDSTIKGFKNKPYNTVQENRNQSVGMLIL